jgi:hypothetical protein
VLVEIRVDFLLGLFGKFSLSEDLFLALSCLGKSGRSLVIGDFLSESLLEVNLSFEFILDS